MVSTDKTDNLSCDQRCKIFHIVLSVISATTKDWIPEDDVRDWWGVVSFTDDYMRDAKRPD